MRHDIGGAAAVFLAVVLIGGCDHRDTEQRTLATAQRTTTASHPLWHAPDTGEIPRTPAGDLTRYGRALIVRTAEYLGPRGTVARRSNGMNCENCHLDAGTRPYSNNFSLVASSYPRFRARSGKTESVEARINDCFERSLNGTALDSTSREMRALVAYMNWVGTGVSRSNPPMDAGTEVLPYLDRPADPTRGRAVYASTCQVCHGATGEGKPDSTGAGYVYPPLWGAHSYNTGAGLYRISRFAGFVKNNMPYGVTYRAPRLTDAEAWDVAAFVNSQPRPSIDMRADWPTLSSKPVDYPFGPYADGYSERQHKYGPFRPIVAARKRTSGTDN